MLLCSDRPTIAAHLGPLDCHPECLATIAGIEGALTIWRVILVSGFIEAITSTIWAW